jgi:CheY-like chemotaxis protein
VVEDDRRVRQLTIKRLKLIGYQVLEASDGPMALEILKSGAAVDLLFTDLIMPRWAFRPRGRHARPRPATGH